jgi:hypothetical protein
MSKWTMRGHLRYLSFNTFPMTPRIAQCEVFWALLSSSKHSGVPEDSKSQLFQVLGFTPTLGQSRGATLLVSSLDVSPKSLPFCFVASPHPFQDFEIKNYSTLMGIYERLLGPSSLECFKAPLIHWQVGLPISSGGYGWFIRRSLLQLPL